MPLYEYSCEDCGESCELLVRTSDRPACPQCGSPRLAKQLSVPAAHVSGANSLPVCEAPRSGGCGAPWCGTGGCGM
jgi:putative FmdB family regulatory protein